MVFVRCVLVRPQHPGNIGAAARVLANFGLNDLVCVTPQCDPQDDVARARAVSGVTVLESARVVESLAEAVADCQLVVATTRRRGSDRSHVVSITELPNLLAQQAGDSCVAVVFGSEEHGLHNEEIAQCQAAIAIPTHPDCPSLNLAQAVGVVAYELCRAPSGQVTAEGELAEHGQLEGMFTQLETALGSIGFFPHGEPFHVMRQLRRALYRAELSPEEVTILRGMARQIHWAGKQVASPDDLD